jgi:hypothetical protein
VNQTRAQSLVEAALQAVIGSLQGLLTQVLIFPLVGVQARLSQNLLICLIFAVISTLRTYAIRRWCNAYLHLLAAWIVARLELWFGRRCT